jgi:hypothetical protein
LDRGYFMIEEPYSRTVWLLKLGLFADPANHCRFPNAATAWRYLLAQPVATGYDAQVAVRHVVRVLARWERHDRQRLVQLALRQLRWDEGDTREEDQEDQRPQEDRRPGEVQVQ